MLFGRIIHKQQLFKKSLSACRRKMNTNTEDGLSNTSNTFDTKPVIAVCQMSCKDNIEENLQSMDKLLNKAKQAGAIMAFFPEACDFITSNTDAIISLANHSETLVEKYKTMANSYNIWMSLGGYHEMYSEDKVRNCHLILNNNGEIIAKYYKVHTFDANLKQGSFRESSFTERGNCIIDPIQTPAGKLGLATCYDVRFPEIGIILAGMGADILSYPSAFTYETGKLYWEVLLRARAIENQCFVVAAAQTGQNTIGRRTYGHSMIINPAGQILAMCNEEVDVAYASIDLTCIDSVRNSVPVWSHKRYDVYPKLKTFPAFGVPCDIQEEYTFGQVVINSKILFYRTELTMAFVNKRCVVPGHVLVAPIRDLRRLSELTTEENSDLFKVVQKVQKVMESIHKTNSSSIVIQDGEDAGQTIWHLHVHILPRKPNDFLENDDVYRELQKSDKNPTTPERNKEEMYDEAASLRKIVFDTQTTDMKV